MSNNAILRFGSRDGSEDRRARIENVDPDSRARVGLEGPRLYIASGHLCREIDLTDSEYASFKKAYETGVSKIQESHRGEVTNIDYTHLIATLELNGRVKRVSLKDLPEIETIKKIVEAT